MQSGIVKSSSASSLDRINMGRAFKRPCFPGRIHCPAIRPTMSSSSAGVYSRRPERSTADATMKRNLLLAACLALFSPVSPAVDTDDDPGAAQLDPDYAAGKRAME